MGGFGVALTAPELLLVGALLLALTVGLSAAARHHLSKGRRRLSLALPLIALLALREDRRGASFFPPRAMLWLALGAGVAFGLDISSWHLGIERTRLGNATVFGNSGSIIVIAWGLLLARRWPHGAEIVAIIAALTGAVMLMGGSLELSQRNFVGDLLSLLAGVLYAAYILMLRHVRGGMGSWRLLTISSLSAAPVILACALMLGETIMPQDWTPLLLLALFSQIAGQGALVWALGWFRPLVIGLALLTQPAVAALTGWLAYGETLSWLDVMGMALMAAALVLARITESKEPEA